MIASLPFISAFFLIIVSASAQPAAPPAPITRDFREADKSNDQYYKIGNDSRPQEGVPQGKFSEAKVIPSRVFPRTQHTYWVYVPAQYDATKPAALMIFNDSQAMKTEPGDVQAHRVLDNLIFRREIPVMLGVFINPGRRPDQPEPNPHDWGDKTSNRADEYNPPTDKYAQVIVEELMPALKKEDYDLNYTWGMGNHGQKQGGAIFPDMMRWLWRDHAVSSDPKDMLERSFVEPAR